MIDISARIFRKVLYQCKYIDKHTSTCSWVEENKLVFHPTPRKGLILSVIEYCPPCPEDVERKDGKVTCFECEYMDGSIAKMGFDESGMKK